MYVVSFFRLSTNEFSLDLQVVTDNGLAMYSHASLY